MKLQWTPTALREYNTVFSRMFEERPTAALEWRTDVRSMTEMIELHPSMGRRHRTTSEGEFREVIVGRYRFIFRVFKDLLEMRRILHVRRDYDPQRIREGGPRGFPVFATN